MRLERSLKLALFLSAALVLTPARRPALAEELPALVADTVYINADQTLVAEGAVEVIYKGQHLTAKKLTYDQATDRLTLEGPITIDDGAGTLMLADEGELSADFRDGILKGARLVLESQLQIAAAEIRRLEGRYTTATRVAASTCQVCPSNPTPLWEIRATRVTHDQQTRQLYYDNAQFRIAGLPVFYIPRLRMPDPTLDRATGFLLPSVRTSSELGLGFKLPYFIAIGPDKDLTVTPYLTAKGGRSVGLRYRQAFRNGELELTGALGRDDIFPGEDRGYLFGTGRFILPRGYRWGFDIETASDDAYLLDYGITDKDRLTSDIFLTRTRRDLFFDARLANYYSLRAADDNDVLPSFESSAEYVRRFAPALIGGQAELRFDLHGLNRLSTVDTDANGDGVTDGRDVARLSLGLGWRRQEILGNGMVLSFGAAVRSDLYQIGQDQAWPGTITRTIPTAAVELSWPWVKPAKGGHSAQVIEPVVQIVWSPDTLEPVPNEDSALVELDEGNLFAFSRFPGADLYESGLRTNVGLRWTRYDPAGWSVGLTAGRILRSEDLGQFSTGSRLSGTRSDWLLAMHLQTDDGLSVINRALFDDALNFSKDELRLDFNRGRYSLGGSYVWLVADPAEGRPLATSELALAAGWQASDHWHVSASGRYDFTADETVKAGLGLTYLSDCARLDLSLSRRFTSSTSVRPSTEVSLTVNLNGFGTGSDGRQYRKSCGG